MGVDTSTKTGYVVFCGDTMKEAGVISHKPRPDRFERFAAYAMSVMNLVEKYEIDVVVIEGYSFAGKFNNSLQYELGAVLRYSLWEADIPFIEVPPTSLKKFVTGKGNVKKDLMLLNVYKRWAFDTEDDNEADAYGLARFGRALWELDALLPTPNMAAVDAVRGSDQPYCKRYWG